MHAIGVDPESLWVCLFWEPLPTNGSLPTTVSGVSATSALLARCLQTQYFCVRWYQVLCALVPGYVTPGTRLCEPWYQVM